MYIHSSPVLGYQASLAIASSALILVTFEDGTDVPNGKVALTHELAEPHLQEHHGRAPRRHEEEVGHEEGTAAVLVAEVREPPDVALQESVQQSPIGSQFAFGQFNLQMRLSQ